jgi:hypothetical protein
MRFEAGGVASEGGHNFCNNLYTIGVAPWANKPQALTISVGLWGSSSLKPHAS